MSHEEKYRQGLELFHQGKFAEALALLGEALGSQETSERWNDWASVQTARGRMAEAEQGFRRALELNAQNGQAAANLGVVLLSTGQTQEAISWLERGLDGIDEKQSETIQKLLEQARTAAGEPCADPEKVESHLRGFLGDDANERAYFETHVRRYVKTLFLMPPAQPGQRLLELGTSFHHLTSGLQNKGYEVRCADYWSGEPQATRRLINRETGEEHSYVVDNFDLLQPQWPYDNGLFDAVVFCEILEHLHSDPMHVMFEINRILRPGGLLLLTTPNIASAKSVQYILRGDSPYVFGQFFAGGVPTDRHNREYTPGEVERLLSASGFQVLTLRTEDSWWRSERSVLARLAAAGLSIAQRGDDIFCLAQKVECMRDRFPAEFYATAGTQHERRERQLQPGPSPTSARKMHVLVANDGLPHFDRAGSDVRLMQLLHSLLRQPCEVTFVARNGIRSEVYQPHLEGLGIKVYAGDMEHLRFAGIDLAADWTLEHVLQQGQFDLAILCQWFWATIPVPEQYLDEIHCVSPKTVVAVLTDDRHGQRERRLAELSGRPTDWERANDYEQRELEVYRQADLVAAISEEDRLGFLALAPDLTIALLAMVAEPAPPGPGFADRSNLLLVANFDNAANLEAVQWFMREAWPPLRARLPSLRISLVGNNAPAEMNRIEGVTVAGHVNELTPYLDQHRIFVSPIRFGTGVKTKNILALSHGLPLVTTSVGAEGIKLQHEQTVLIADAPQDFAACVARLYLDRDLWQRLHEEGRQHVLREFASEKLDQQVAAFLELARRTKPKVYDPGHCFSSRRVELEYPDVLRHLPVNERIPFRMVKHLELAERLRQQGQLEAARDQLRHTFALFPHLNAGGTFFAEVFEKLAQYYRGLGQPSQATRALRAVKGCVPMFTPPLPRSPAQSRQPALDRAKNTLALCMIVRNAEQDLPACLESVRDVVQEIVIADTGSTDKTVEIARQLGARVISIPWQQDFAAARNAALESVRSSWVLALDADEELDPSARRSLPELLRRRDIWAYRVPVRHYVSDANVRGWDQRPRRNDSRVSRARKYPAYVQQEIVRLFRRRGEIFFEGRVHEMVDRSVLRAGGVIGDAKFCIHHYGHVAGGPASTQKNLLYRELGRLKLQDMPNDTHAHIELGLQELDNFNNPAEALQYFDRACQIEPQNETGWLFAGITLVRLERFREAIDRLQHVPRHGRSAALLAETDAEAHFGLGDFEEAVRRYEDARRLSPDDSSLESKLGLCELRSGKTESGLARLRQAVRRAPATAELHDRLVAAYVSLERLDEAARFAEAKIKNLPSPEAFMRAASIRAQLQQWTEVGDLLHRGLQRFPSDPRLQRALSEIPPESKNSASAGAR